MYVGGGERGGVPPFPPLGETLGTCMWEEGSVPSICFLCLSHQCQGHAPQHEASSCTQQGHKNGNDACHYAQCTTRRISDQGTDGGGEEGRGGGETGSGHWLIKEHIMQTIYILDIVCRPQTTSYLEGGT